MQSCCDKSARLTVALAGDGQVPRYIAVWITVCNGHHWGPHSRALSQPEPAVCNTTKKQLAHPERSATHRPTSSSVQSRKPICSTPGHLSTPNPNPPTPFRRPRPAQLAPFRTWSLQPRPASTCRKLLRQNSPPPPLGHRLPSATPDHRQTDTHNSNPGRKRKPAHDAVDDNSPAPRPSGCHILHPPSRHHDHIPPRHAGGSSSSSTGGGETGLRDAPGPAAKGLPPAAGQEVGRGGRGHLQQAGQVLPHDRDGERHVRPAGAVLPATVSWTFVPGGLMPSR